MRKRYFRVYRKIYPKANAFAREEYVEPYEKDALNKGYYHGYVAGVKAMKRALNNLSLGKKFVDGIVESVLGKPKLL